MNAASERAPRGALAAAAAVAAVHALAGWGHSFGSASDEAFFVRLALALRGGAYSLPGPFGGPVTDPLPGYPALIAPAVWALAPAWERLWVLGLAATLAAAWLTWRLARRLLTPRAAGAVGLLAALSPALVAQSGVVMPDAAFAAVAAAAFLVLASGADGGIAFGALAALGALGGLLRPYGAILPAALALGVAARRGPRSGACLLALALLPLAACLARNRFAAGTATDYAAHWSLQAAAFTPALLAEHAYAAAASVLGRGAAGVADGPVPAAALAGLLLLTAAARGARLLARGPERPVALALAAFAGALVAVHLTWRFASARYALSLLAPLWILAAAGVERSGPAARRVGTAAALVLGACALSSDAALARVALDRKPPALARVGAWARASLPPDARLESFACQPLELQAQRPVECASVRDPREAWLAHLLDARIGWVHELPGWAPDGFMPPGMDDFQVQSQGWLRDAADFEEVFADPAEGRVFRLKPRDEARDRAALAAFLAARAALSAGDEARARRGFEEAVRLRPRFAYAWAQLALLEHDRARAAALLRRAAEGDPASVRVRAALKILETPPAL